MTDRMPIGTRVIAYGGTFKGGGEVIGLSGQNSLKVRLDEPLEGFPPYYREVWFDREEVAWEAKAEHAHG